MAIWLRARKEFTDNRFQLLFIYIDTNKIDPDIYMEPAWSYFYKGQESIHMDTSNMTHVEHGRSVYITVNPAVSAHSCAFPWLHM